MKFTQIPTDTFKQLQLNAGILLDSFTPATGVIGNILGATSGGVSFDANPTYKDNGEDIDNCPKNTKELKELESWEAKLAGTFLTVTPTVAKSLLAAADVDSGDATHVIPRDDLLDTDFSDIWWVGDYSDKNGESNGGFMAIHLMNALSTSGFHIKSGDKAKGQMSMEYTAHYSIDDPKKVPFEMYIKAGTAEPI